METKPDEIPAHEPAPKETETFELIRALLKNGWKISRGNEWVNTPQGGYFLIKAQKDGQSHAFESQMSLPFIIGPDGQIR